MPSLREPATVAFVFAWISACNNNGSSSHPDGASISVPVPLSNLSAMAQQAECEQNVRCESFPDVATCKASRAFSWDQLVAGVNASRIQYDGGAAAQCLDALRAKGCNWTDDPEVDPPVCLKAFKGMGGGGATCFVNEDCMSVGCNTTSCSPAVACCAGTCTDPPDTAHPVPLGGDCSAPAAACVDGSLCYTPSSKPTCIPGLLAGQDCNPDDHTAGWCLHNLDCVPSSSALGGTCTPPPAEGEVCYSSPKACNPLNDYCDQVSDKCLPKILVGQPCPASYACVVYAICDSGICVSLKRSGEPCEITGSNEPCMGSLRCQNGMCTLPDPPPVCP